MLQGDTWLKIASRANGHAKTLADGLAGIDGVEILFPVEANAVFVRFAPNIDRALQEQGWHYYSRADIGDSRLMCSWHTTESDVQEFLSAVRQAASHPQV